jgi:iron complex outermembrane recepter protein
MKPILRFIIPFLLASNISLAQTLITGVVRDGDGSPIPSATVVIRGTTINTQSDLDGKFSITSQQKLPFTLLFTFSGYKEQEVEIYELPDAPLEIIMVEDLLGEVVITSRRRTEVAQNVPIPVSVVSGKLISEAGAFNVNRIKELIPTVQLYSSNPRNTGINIRGIGSPFGLTNDGLDPGVGFYVDGVYYARPAAATLDFLDVERIEVLRGPQGTLFGKNTTAGAFNITTRKPSFTPGGDFEVSYGNYGYIQAKTSITGPISGKLAGRISFSGTQRDGLIKNFATGQRVNDINNIGTRGQLLFTPTNDIDITLAGD